MRFLGKRVKSLQRTRAARLVKSEVLDLEAEETTVELGAPDRLSFRNVVDGVRRTSQYNIVYF